MRTRHSGRSERRILREIEAQLAADGRLAGMYLTFARLNSGEALPAIERVKNGPACRAWRGVRAFLAFVFVPPQPVDARLRAGPPGSR